MLRGRVQGSLDVSHAVMAVNKKSYRIDLDAGDILYHMKVNVSPPVSKPLTEYSLMNKCLSVSGKKPRALLHLGDQASSSPLVQEERGGSHPQWPADGAVPLRRGRASSQERRPGDYRVKVKTADSVCASTKLCVPAPDFCRPNGPDGGSGRSAFRKHGGE